MDDARRTLLDLERASRDDYFSPSFIAAAHGVLEDKDRAFDELEKACEYRASLLTYIRAYRNFEPFRSDSGFQDFLRRTNFPSLSHLWVDKSPSPRERLNNLTRTGLAPVFDFTPRKSPSGD